jgi:hypothetical protein
VSSADRPIFRLFVEGETVVAAARAGDAELVVTDRRVAIATENGRLAMNLPIEHLRRIQFDIERTRPATLVIVPDHAGHEPQVLSIPPEQIDTTTQALAFVGKRLAQVT